MKINSTAAKHIKKYCYIIGLLSFLIAFFACSQMLRYQEKEKKASGTYMAQSTIRRVKAKLENYIMISDFLGNYIIDGSDMDENTFSELAEKIPNEEGVVKAFELAPEGIITEIYPMQGNSEALGLDVLREHERKKDAVLAKETGEYTLGGPYQLKQGGTGALLFKPVYRTDDFGESSFWGFVLQVIDWNRFMSDINLKSLSEADFSYKIWSYDRSSGDKVILAQSQDDMPENSLTIECEIPNNTWYFDIVPSNGWTPVSQWILSIIASYIFSLLIAMVFYQIFSKKHREKQYAAELEKAAELAKSANEAKTRFLFNMSHDIRTPMNAIIGFTDLALKADGDVIQQKKYLTKISIASRHLLALINDILEMSRIESGKVLLKETKCNISQIFGGLNTIMAGQVQEKGQKLQIIFCEIQNEEIWCDELRLKQVLINLVGNANKFTPEGGEITITVCQTEKEHNGVAGYRILVKDNGVGMTESFLKRIYEPFEREETSTVSGITGTGLGLSITKSIVDLFGGSMEIRSKKNQGTEVILDLSLKLKPPKEENDLPEENVIVEQDSEQLEFSGKRVLLAEDNDLNCEIAEELLSQKGICVEVAENGAEAVEKVKNSEPGYYEVILMDIQMPVMDGYEATRQIRSLEDAALAKIPIIALSANAFEEDRRASREAGMDGHLAKPIETAKLFAVLKEIIKKE